MSGAAPADAGLGREKSSRLLLGRDGRKILIGIVLIVLVVFGQKLYGMATASSRLDPALRDAAEPRNVIVVLDFMPDRFHNELIICTHFSTRYHPNEVRRLVEAKLPPGLRERVRLWL